MKIKLTKSELEDVLTALDDAISSREQEAKTTDDPETLKDLHTAIEAITHVYETILEQAKQQGY